MNTETGIQNAHKNELLGNFGRDAWHTADEAAKWGDRFGAACFMVGSAIEVCKVSIRPHKSDSARKRAVRRKILGCAAKGAALWAISSLTEMQVYQAITTAR